VLILSGANTYTGPTYVNEGQVRVTAPQAIPPNATLELNGGEYRLDFGSAAPVDLGVVNLREESGLTLLSLGSATINAYA
jgi:autotransporter-associated beta strand protein